MEHKITRLLKVIVAVSTTMVATLLLVNVFDNAPNEDTRMLLAAGILVITVGGIYTLFTAIDDINKALKHTSHKAGEKRVVKDLHKKLDEHIGNPKYKDVEVRKFQAYCREHSTSAVPDNVIILNRKDRRRSR